MDSEVQNVISKLRQTVQENNELQDVMSKLEAQMQELEKQMRELESNKRWMQSELTQLTNDRNRVREAERVVESISLFLRKYYATEIDAGLHSGMKLDEVVFRYLMRERRWHEAGLLSRIMMALRGEL